MKDRHRQLPRIGFVLLASCWALTAGATRTDGRTPVISAPKGDEPVCASIYRPGQREGRQSDEPLRLGGGPQLFVDDFLIEESSGLTRRVNRPTRQTSNPIITAKKDGVFQPYVTVICDPQSGRFRMWYGARTPARDVAASRLVTMESADGIHWVGPPRLLTEPGPIRFFSSVVDDGPDFPDPQQRFKLAYHTGGLNIATSPDGLRWTMLRREAVLEHNHDINNLCHAALRNQYVAPFSVSTTGRTWSGSRRATMHSTSRDLLHWEKPWYVLTPDDRLDQGRTEFYAMSGYIQRGGLWIGLVKLLRDDLVAAGTARGSYGMGYTTLAWSRDGRRWQRDRTAYFEPDPKPGAWDHAHAWIDCQTPVGKEVFLYYGGYKNGHKVNRFEERQIGMLRIPRDRYVSRDAEASEGVLRTPPVLLAAQGMTINANVAGSLQVRMLDLDGNPIEGLDAGDHEPIRGDSLAHTVRWRKPLAEVGGKPVRIEFRLRDAQLYGFDLAAQTP